MAELKRNGARRATQNGSKRPAGNGSKRLAEAERLGRELEKVNTRITQHAEWIRALSNDMRRLGEKLYGLTEGTVTLSDVKLPAGRYRTPDQAQLASSEFQLAAERMAEVKRRFASMEKDFAIADDLRDQMERGTVPARRQRKAS
ncbi:MAG: hypothetical protein ABR599_08070 [Gemmatimonadota bacterium]